MTAELRQEEACSEELRKVCSRQRKLQVQAYESGRHLARSRTERRPVLLEYGRHRTTASDEAGEDSRALRFMVGSLDFIPNGIRNRWQVLSRRII